MSNLELYRNIGLIVICYLVGAIPFCNIIAKIHSKKDLRKIGDRNPGGWNLVFNIFDLRDGDNKESRSKSPKLRIANRSSSVGSIGVIMQLPNFELKGEDIP